MVGTNCSDAQMWSSRRFLHLKFCPARSAGVLNPFTRKIVFVRPSVRASVCTLFPYCDFATFHFLFGEIDEIVAFLEPKIDSAASEF